MAYFTIPGAPDHELLRSPAAQRVGHLAEASGLRLSHFEHRHHLALPDHWLPTERLDLGTLSGAHAQEQKYLHHRNDNPVGSFNPNHRAKWTAHELLHGLVGFAWRPDASPFYLTLSARLSEILPVALWYFLDEAHLQRCPQHDGPLFNARCPACEEAAAHGPKSEDPRAAYWLEQGKAFVERELSAIHRARRTGQLVTHRYATIDLNSDALAYISSHHGRLTSPSFHRYHALFHADGALGWHAELDQIIARVEALTEDLCGGQKAAPLAGSAQRVVAQDLGWRLLQIGADCEGDATALLDELAVSLAENPEAIAPVIERYSVACKNFWLPPAEEVFAVGYDLPLGVGRDSTSIHATLTEVCPNTELTLGEDFGPNVHAFVHAEPNVRGPAARRFAAFLPAGPLADLVHYEAACAHPALPDPAPDTLGEGDLSTVARVDGVELLRLESDPDCLIRALDGQADAADADKPVCMVIRRRAGGEVLVAEISTLAADALDALTQGPKAPKALSLPPVELSSLLSLGVIRPARWRETF